MSVHDVAAVDHLNSLQRPRKSEENRLFLNFESKQSSRRSPYHVSLPTSPTRERKTDGDTLRRAMARHQASLSRPESPQRGDSIPTQVMRYPSYARQTPTGSPAPERRPHMSPTMRRDGYRTVGATRTTSSLGTKVNSSEFLSRENSPEDVSKYSASTYPYLSPSTHSLPRNHKLYKNRLHTTTLRESQESLFNPHESKDTLLGRYPSSSFNNTHLKPDVAFQPYGHNSKYSSTANSLRSSRNNSPIRRLKLNSYDSDVHLTQRSVPVSPGYSAYSLCSSREVSPENTSGAIRRPISPSYSIPSLDSRRSSRASSPAFSLKSDKSTAKKGSSTREYVRISRSGSLRSSRATSPNSVTAHQTNIQTEVGDLFSLEELKKNPLAEVIYVRETFKVVPSQINRGVTERTNEDEINIINANEFPNAQLVKLGTEESHFLIKNSLREDNSEKESINQTDEAKVSQKEGISLNECEVGAICQDDFVDTRSVATQESCCSDSMVKANSVDLSLEGIDNIEELLDSLSRKVKSVKESDPAFVDNDDSARAESVSSLVSSPMSAKGRQFVRESHSDGNSHSLIRRQSVIIEGLTMETEELRKKCQSLEEELGTPAVQDLSLKLEQVEGKLEETENYCYQVVEENVELKSEIETLESEISEVQDTFRDKDAKEFKKVKWELENLSKTCRNLQIKLGKAQAKASRLRQEKEMIEEEQREKNLWKTSAVVAVAAVAAYQLISRLK